MMMIIIIVLLSRSPLHFYAANCPFCCGWIHGCLRTIRRRATMNVLYACFGGHVHSFLMYMPRYGIAGCQSRFMFSFSRLTLTILQLERHFLTILVHDYCYQCFLHFKNFKKKANSRDFRSLSELLLLIYFKIFVFIYSFDCFGSSLWHMGFF